MEHDPDAIIIDTLMNLVDASMNLVDASMNLVDAAVLMEDKNKKTASVPVP